MNAEFQPGRRIAAVITRDMTAKAGRPAILSAIIASLRRNNDLRLFRLRNIFELGFAGTLAGVVMNWFAGLARGRPLPLQCALYSSPAECDRIAGEIAKGGFDAVYLDTVRCFVLLERLRRICPDLHVVTDFDDLMSRRMAFLSRSGLPFLTGHTASSIPGWIRAPLETWLSRAITGYEAATLPTVEDHAIALSSATVLLSAVERDVAFRRQSAPPAASIATILPAMALHRQPWRAAPLRFVFIGSDTLIQNRIAIAVLIDKWRTLNPRTPLHIYGRQSKTAPQVANVFFHGHVEDLAEVYQPGSIALVPALGTGGIKTKVAEAWAWGCPVLCNSAALEGFGIEDYLLALPETAWDPLITEPHDFTALWRSAAGHGQQFVRRSMSQEGFDAAWHTVMGLEDDARERAAPFGVHTADLIPLSAS